MPKGEGHFAPNGEDRGDGRDSRGRIVNIDNLPKEHREALHNFLDDVRENGTDDEYADAQAFYGESRAYQRVHTNGWSTRQWLGYFLKQPPGSLRLIRDSRVKADTWTNQQEQAHKMATAIWSAEDVQDVIRVMQVSNSELYGAPKQSIDLNANHNISAPTIVVEVTGEDTPVDGGTEGQIGEGTEGDVERPALSSVEKAGD